VSLAYIDLSGGVAEIGTLEIDRLSDRLPRASHNLVLFDPSLVVTIRPNNAVFPDVAICRKQPGNTECVERAVH
jgi:hypothetical protein